MGMKSKSATSRGEATSVVETEQRAIHQTRLLRRNS
jgi:hypothetical protein